MVQLVGAGFAIPALVTLQLRDVAADCTRARGLDVGAGAARSVRAWLRDGWRWWARPGTVALFVGMHGEAVCYSTVQYALARVRHRGLVGTAIHDGAPEESKSVLSPAGSSP